jgi:hypothetical protein
MAPTRLAANPAVYTALSCRPAPTCATASGPPWAVADGRLRMTGVGGDNQKSISAGQQKSARSIAFVFLAGVSVWAFTHIDLRAARNKLVLGALHQIKNITRLLNMFEDLNVLKFSEPVLCDGRCYVPFDGNAPRSLPAALVRAITPPPLPPLSSSGMRRTACLARPPTCPYPRPCAAVSA